MSKRRGFLKQNRRNGRRVEVYSMKRFPEVNQKENRGPVQFIAIDSCIAIDMVKILNGTAPFKSSPRYYGGLKKLLMRSIFGKGRSYNPSGDVCLCIIPGVKKELSKKDGETFMTMKKFLNDRTVVFEVEESSRKNFNKKVEKLVNDYCAKGYFLDRNNAPTQDGYNVAEASYFNLTFLSRDGDVCKNIHDRNPERKSYTIKSINRRAFCNDFNGEQAEPRRIDSVMTKLDHDRMPEYMHEEVLTERLQELLHAIKSNAYRDFVARERGSER